MRQHLKLILVLVTLVGLAIPLQALAAEADLEAELQAGLLKSQALVQRIQQRLDRGQSIDSELKRLNSLARNIRISHMLLSERFSRRQERADALGSKAARRHADMLAAYRQVIAAYLDAVERLQNQKQATRSIVEELKDLLDQAVVKPRKPVFGSLPYRRLNYTQKLPVPTPAITPAYKGGDPTVTPEDLQSTPLAPISAEIAALAESLNWNPAEIYQWVKNNIQTQWYWGAMKGAAETLRQGSGNDCDQAALLVALLRSAGYPSRYVQGVIEFFPDIETVKNLTGVQDPALVADFFRHTGIPYSAVMDGPDIVNYQIEHIWVETRVPHANYRGNVIDAHGKTWLGLDTSIKAAGYTYSDPGEVLLDLPLSGLRDNYLQNDRTETFLEYLRTDVQAFLTNNAPGTTYNEVLLTASQKSEQLNILPAALQFVQVAVTAEHTRLPDALKHRVHFTAADADTNELFNITVDTYTLSNQALSLSYDPDTPEDQEIINSYGGLDRTPSYLVSLRPVLKLNDQRLSVSRIGLAMGLDYTLTVELISPNGSEQISNHHIVGNLALIGVVSRDAVMPAPLADEEKDAVRLLAEGLADYINRWNQAEDELASLMQVRVVRPIPTVVTIGGVVDVTFLLNMPHDFEWKGIYIDADLRAIATIGGLAFTDITDTGRTFMQLASLEGSVLEGEVLADDFQVDSISTARLLGLANAAVIPILVIDSTNIGTVLPGLTFDQAIIDDITAAVNAGQVVQIPDQEVVYEDWTGVGYVKENTTSGESGWMLSGLIEGGMTTWSDDRWPEYYRSRMEHPYSQPPNQDPASAVAIEKIGFSDHQKYTVGKALPDPLQVIARDSEMKPVMGVEVTFTVKAGGGRFAGNETTLTVTTDYNGIAAAPLTLGQSTYTNPSLVWESGYTHNMQVDQTIVDAEFGAGITLNSPFTTYGYPAGVLEELDPDYLTDRNAWQMTKLHGDEEYHDVLGWSGFISIKIGDGYGNPISNLPVTFAVQSAVEHSSCQNPNADTRPAILIDDDDTCLDVLPLYEQCTTGQSSRPDTTSSKGASVQVVLGAIPDATYPITATHAGLSQTFNLHTYAFGNCDGETIPQVDLNLSYKYRADITGFIISAGKPGNTIPLQAQIHFLKEGDVQITEILPCAAGDLPCPKIVGSREYSQDTTFDTASVTFEGQDGTAEGNGTYTFDYTLQPGVNVVNIGSAATITVQRSFNWCPDHCEIRDVEISRNIPGTMTVYGVEIQTETEVLVAADDDGYSTCDIPIKYTITPAEYKASTAYVEIYKDGQTVALIPTETQGEGFATLSKGFWFEPGITYDAEVVLNRGSDVVEIKSEKISLTPTDVKIETIYIEDGHDNLPILAGQTAKAIAVTQPAGREVIWSIIHKDDKVKAEIKPGTGVIEAKEGTGSGYITIRATDAEIDCVIKEEKVPIGCMECVAASGQCNVKSGGRVKNGSIDTRISLGNAQRGQSAGEIFLRSERPSTILSTPRPLTFSTLARNIEVLYDDENLLRQILAPESFVDIVVNDEFSYDINFYHPEEITGQTDGFYTVDGATQPFSVWRFENPDASPTVYNRLKVTEIREGTTRVYEYIWDEAQSAWSLSRGNGLQIETKAEFVDAGQNNRIVTNTITDKDDNVASVVQTTFHGFAWGEEIIEEIIDPAGDALTTVTTYYENENDPGSYKRVKSRVGAYGSWVHFQYDDIGRTSVDVRSWLDTPAGTPAASARAIYYGYTPVDPQDSGDSRDENSPRTVTEKVLGITVAKTFYSYRIELSGERTEIVEQCADPAAVFGATGNLRTVTTYYPSGTDLADSGAVKSILSPDGPLQSFTYEFGTYTPNPDPAQPGSFTAGTGSAIQTSVVSGTAGSPTGIAYKTTRQISIQDEFGRQPMQTVEVYDGSTYHQIQWAIRLFNEFGRLTDTYQSNGTRTQSTWGCCVKDSETDAAGIQKTYEYDDLQRIQTETKKGIAAGAFPAQSDIQTSFTYDAAGRQLTQTVSADGLSLSTASVYDGAGRFRSTTDPAQLATSYEYDPSGLVTTVTRPGGATEVTTRFQDGRTKSTTGTGAIARYYKYGVNADGTRWTKVLTGSPASPRWEKTTVDLLGRTVKSEKPGYSGIETTENFYNPDGRLVKTTNSGLADTIYEYDELGNQVRNGLDVDRSGALEAASNDRISETETLYAFINSNWWQESRQRVYARENVATASTTATSRLRLTGWSGSITSERLNIDIHGNQSRSWSVTDPAGRKTTRYIDFPDSSTDAASIMVNGLLVSSRSKTSVTTTYGYDALGRRTGVADPRTGTAATHFNSKNQVEYIEDAAGNRTTFAYEPDSGQKSSETNAINKTTRYIYNQLGQVTHTWGDVPYPVKYEYDSYGQLHKMSTYRGGSNWASAIWPAGDTGTADVTTWHYHAVTGLLEAKEDAAGQSVTYTYSTGNRLATRIWARKDTAGDPLFTSYHNDANTGELLGIDYSDTTPDVDITYDRLGRQKTVTDAVGIRTFAYNSALQLKSETITGLYNQVITRTYETSTVVGRSTGFNLGADYGVTYGYDGNGRFNSVAWDVAGQADTATYGYVTNSDLHQQLTTSNGLKTTYSYEPNRNLRTQVKNEYSANLISQYDYQYDPIGRRTSVANSGQAFAANAFNRFGYDDRNQLTESSRYLGTNIEDLNNPVAAENRTYQYDPIGNRQQAVGWDDGASAPGTDTFNTNALNQYDQITADNGPPAMDNLAYDLDGNLISVASADSTKQYKYNAENRLIAVEPQIPVDGDKKIEFVYDFVGRRVQKKVFIRVSGLWQENSEKLFVYNGWNVIIEETDLGQSIANKYYIWGLDLSQALQGAGGIGGLLASADSSLTHYYCFDGNGNVGQLINATDGSLSAHYEYDPYGRELISNGSEAGTNLYRFSTKYFDNETELYYYGYRYYSPQLGRWLNRDPLGEEGGINYYLFSYNNGIDFFDLLGLWVEVDQIISPSKSLSLIRKYESEIENGAFKNQKLLTYLAKKFFPGAQGRGSNNFVFTCKYGWIDLGHYFMTATLGYATNDYIAYQGGGIGMEELQKKFAERGIEGGMAESTYTPEDLYSDFFGAQLGSDAFWKNDRREVEKALLTLGFYEPKLLNIANEWNQFLKNSGAINADLKEVREILEKDVAKLWNGDIYTGERPETKEAQLQYQRKILEAFCLFCDGDKPREGYGYY